jgi:hypothetical protein
MSGGGYHVYRRRVIVVDDWTEVVPGEKRSEEEEA